MARLLKLSEVNIDLISQVGGKNASLGEMFNNLTDKGIKVPDGFVVTTDAYEDFLKYNNLVHKINDITSNIDVEDIVSLRRNGLAIRRLIEDGEFSTKLEMDICNAYTELSNQYTVDGVPQQATDVAVRSSSTAEDLKDASFAGQQETYLNIRGKNQVISAIKNCFASLYTDRAISYRKQVNYTEKLSISVCVQKMVRSDLASSGVAFSIDPDSGFNKAIVINGVWGLGELLVQGGVKPDEFIVFKPTLEKGYDAIIDKKIGNKTQYMVYGTNPDEKVKLIPVNKKKKNKFCISDEKALQLAKWVLYIEKYYSDKYEKYTPIDIEWAVDGLTDELYIVQARPETVHSQNEHNIINEYKINTDKTPIVSGVAVGDKIVTGTVRIIHTLDDRGTFDDITFEDGDILVTDMTDPDWEPIMRKASGIITNKGARTCHCAIIAREMGISAIVGTNNCTSILKTGDYITLSCAEGDIGYVYEGSIPFKVRKLNLETVPDIKTDIMLNIASPSIVFKYWSYPVKGVGLVREEFIINNFIQAHPSALLDYDTLKDVELKDKLTKLIKGYESPKDYFIKKLVFGLSRIASTFYPNDVIVRFSDFKSNEYFNLLGGKYYEPDEENPMIGWRGASRYYSDDYRREFGLECEAIKIIRDVIGLTNVIMMIPFCRTPGELLKVYEVMAEHGLERGKNNLQVYVMCEVPSNVILADEFCKYVDGFSIGSNDLTQLTLGLDRDSSLVSHIYDERNLAVKKMISMAIKTCKENNVKIGICGQGPSDYQDFAQFLVEEGIDSISITPDSIIKTINAIHNIEAKL